MRLPPQQVARSAHAADESRISPARAGSSSFSTAGPRSEPIVSAILFTVVEGPSDVEDMAVHVVRLSGEQVRGDDILDVGESRRCSPSPYPGDRSSVCGDGGQASAAPPPRTATEDPDSGRRR